MNHAFKLQSVVSINRLKKILILVRERIIGLKPVSLNSAFTESGSHTEPRVNTWISNESRAIDATYYKMAEAEIVEDRVLDNGEIYTEHEYLVHELYGGISYTNEVTHRSIYSSIGERVAQLSSARKGIDTQSNLRIPITKTVEGVTINLYGTVASAEGNYFHWFIDALARLFIIQKYHQIGSTDKVLVPPLRYDFQWDSLAAFGFDRSRVIELKPLECIQFERLIACSPPRGKGSAICPGWSVDNYRSTLLPKAVETELATGKKIFISRRDAPNRMFLNEIEVCNFMESRGFDVVELTPLNLWQKIALFRDAEVIVGQTGAGLTNLMFCNSTVKVLEIVDKRFVYPLYASLVAYVGGVHHAHFFATNRTHLQKDAILTKATLDLEDLGTSLRLIE